MRYMAMLLILAGCAGKTDVDEPAPVPPPPEPAFETACDGAAHVDWCRENNAPTAYGYDALHCADPPWLTVDGVMKHRPSGTTGCTTFSQSGIGCCAP